MTSATIRSPDDIVPPASAGGAVAFLPAPSRRRVQAAEPRIRLVDSWAAVAEAASAFGGGVIIADPTHDGGATGDAMEELCRRLPALVPVVYASLTPSLVRHLRALARFEFSDVILVDYDDTPRRFAELADLADSNSLIGNVLRRLEPSLCTAPPQVRRAVRDLFQSPPRYRSVDDLAAAASMPRRSFYRHIESLGLVSPRLLITASRVVRAVGILRDPQRTVRETARRLGYSKSEHLADHVALLTGLRVREIRRADLGAVALTIAARLTTLDPTTEFPRVAG